MTPLKAPLLEPGTADVMGLSLAKDERKELRQSPKPLWRVRAFNPAVGIARMQSQQAESELWPGHLPLACRP